MRLEKYIKMEHRRIFKLNLIRDNMKINKRGLSPVIASIMLILIVIVIAVIIFFALRGMSGEVYEKFSGTSTENVANVCGKLNFDASYDGGILSITNNGNIPIIDFSIKLKKAGTTDVFKITSINSDFKGLAKGESDELDISSKASGYSDAVVIPVLLAKGVTSGKSTNYVCPDSDGGEITL